MATTDPGGGAGPRQRSGPRWGWWAGWGVVAVLAVAISLFSFPPYLPLVPDVERIPLDPGFPDRHTLVIALLSMEMSHSPFLSAPGQLAGHLDSLAKL